MTTYDTDELPVLRGLQTVRVNKEALVEVVRKNRDDHRAIFEEALEGWKAAVTRALEDAVADAKAGKEYRIVIGLVKPEDHTSDYNAVLRMMELSLDEELELQRSEFANYVLDEWGWQHSFLATSSNYVSSARNTRRIQDKEGR